MFPFRGYSGNCKSKLNFNFEEVLLGRNLLLAVTLLFSKAPNTSNLSDLHQP